MNSARWRSLKFRFPDNINLHRATAKYIASDRSRHHRSRHPDATLYSACCGIGKCYNCVTFLMDFARRFGKYWPRMFSLQQLFGKGDKFNKLLEAAASEAHESVRLVIALMQSPRNTKAFDDLVLARRKEKKISEQISEELVQTFVTGLEREDIEALARGLYKIPKSAEKLAERFMMAGRHVEGIDFSKQAEMMEKATGAVHAMIKQLDELDDLEKIKTFNDKLQYVEGEADKVMNDLLRELYSGEFDALRAIVLRDIYELIEKVIDRSRDVGNVMMHIVLKNS
jgi:uncharacterized protein Yka (UPF0111/DUF47 family)